MRYDQRVTEHRRLDILRILAASPQYEASQMLIYQALPMHGSADQVKADLAWLEEQGLVILHDVGSIRLARITMRGVDASQGLCRVPGVARPLPEE